MKPTPDEIEEKRLRRILAVDGITDFEREDAERALAKLQERRDPTCAHCEQRTSTHGSSACPVVATFQRSHGRGLTPTASQAAEIRHKLASEETARMRAETKRAAKNNQGSLF